MTRDMDCTARAPFYLSACLLVCGAGLAVVSTAQAALPQRAVEAAEPVEVVSTADASADVAAAAAVDPVDPAYELYQQAYAAYEAEDWRKAQRLVDRAIAINPQNGEYHKLSGYIAGKRDDHAGVLRAAEAALALDGSDAEALEMRGNAHYFMGHRDRTVDDYRRAIALHGHDSDVYRKLMHVLNEMQRDDELLDVYESFEKQRRNAPDEMDAESDVPFYAALVHYRRKDYPRTIALLSESIKLSPEFAGYYGNRGAAYDGLKEYTRALSDYATAIRLAPKDPLNYYNRGLTWLNMREYQRASDDLTKAHALGNDESNLWLNLGAAHDGLGQDGAALRAYDRALQLDPGNAAARSNRVSLLRKKGKTQAAERDHAQVLAAVPDDAAASLRYNDALGRVRAGDWAGAVPLLQQAVRLKPDFEQAWVNLGAAHAKLGQRQQALDVFNDVLDRFPESSLATINRAQLLTELGDTQPAGRDYQRALALEPTNADYMQRLARHYASNGDARKARDYFERARAAAADDAPEVYINYSAFLLEAGDNRKALVVAREGAERFRSDYGLVINLANAQSAVGDFKAAAETYRRAIKLQPERLDAYFNLGNLYAWDMKQLAKGIEWFRRALQHAPDPSLDASQQLGHRQMVRVNLASALDLAGDRAGALAMLQEAIDAHPDDYSLYFNRAAIAVRAGDQVGARRDYLATLERMQRQQAALAGGDAPDLLEHRGYVLFYLGREKEAAGELQRLLQLEPERHSAQRSLGYVLLDLNRSTEACRLFDKAFAAEPDEIDGWLGLLACTSLAGDTGRLGALKAQFNKRFADRYVLDGGLPQRLIESDYWYSAAFRQLWGRVTAVQ